MHTANPIHIITAPLHAVAARYRALAVEAELQALMAIRNNAATIQRTEQNYRALIVAQARHLRHARRIEKRMKVAQ